MACKRLIKETNNQPSELFDYIYENIANQNEQEAESLWTYFKSDIFKDEFGNWVEEFKLDILDPDRTINSRNIDDNGEPKLRYDKAKAAHYYVSKIGRKIYYPNNINKLNESFSHEAIREVTRILALKFIEPRLNDNFDNMNLEEMTGTLSESIKTQLTNKSNELINSNNFDKKLTGKALQESMQYLDEWTRHVENFYRELKLVYNENTETDDMIEEDNNTRGDSVFGKSSFEKSSKDNITSNIKLRLSLLVSEELDPIFNEPKFVSFDEVYSVLQKALTNKVALENEDLYEIYKQEIFNLQDKKPYIKSLYEQLSNINEYHKAELVQAFNLDKNNFIGTIFDMKPIEENGVVIGFKTDFIVQNLSNAGGKSRFVKNNWFYNFNKNFSNDKGTYTQESRGKYGKIKAEFNKYFISVKNDIKNNQYSENNFNEAIDPLLSIFNELGLTTSPSGLNHYLDGLNSLEQPFEEKVKNFNRLLEATKWFLDNTQLGGVLTSNPFDTQSEFNKLADANAFYLSEGSDASFFSVGKSKWVYSYPSYLSTKIKRWKKSRSVMLADYQSTIQTESSHYFKYFLGIGENIPEELQDEIYNKRLEEFELNIFNSLQEPGDTVNAVDNVDMSKNDAFNDNFNKILGFRKAHTKTHSATPTPADKSTQHTFTLPKGLMFSTNADMDNGKIHISDPIKKVLYNYVKGEYKRILQAKKEIELAGNDLSKLYVHYHLTQNKDTNEWEAINGNALKFQLFPSLNSETFDSKEMGFELYDENGILDLTFKNIDELDLMDLTPNTIESKLIEFIENTIGTNIFEMQTHLEEIGMIEIDKNGKTINKAFDTEIWDSYDNNDTSLKIAGDIFLNNLVSQFEYTKLFSGDIAYYKDEADYKKRVPATYTDGQQLYLKEGQELFNASIINSVKGIIPRYEAFEKAYGKEVAEMYKNNNAADAQAWIKPTRWKFLKQGLGQWSNAHDVVYDKITGKNKESFTIEEMKMSAQPLKGVYFDINNGVPTFLKYSQAVLTPQLIKNNKGLKILSDKMGDNIDELITLDGIKVGSNLPIQTHDENGDVKDNFTLNTLKLKNSGWKLQQDLPIKTNKDTSIGSQIQKNIFGGLAYYSNSTFDVDGTEMSSNDLINNINSLFNKLSDLGLNSLFTELGIDSNYKITDPQKLNASLIKQLKGDSKANQNVIDALESNISTYSIAGIQQKVQNAFASMVLNRVVKIQTNGGAYIQMSNYGFSNTEANSKGVIYTPWAEDKLYEPTITKEPIYDENGILTEKGVVEPGGILISGSFIAKYVPDYKTMSAEKLFGTKENDYTDGLIDKKILNSIIGYRIPNQGLASNDALAIMGILPEENGDTVVAYTGITTKTGSDFDIDKMYIMMPSFKPKMTKHTYKKGFDYIKDNDIPLEIIKEELIAEGYSKTFIEATKDHHKLFVEDILFQDSNNEYHKEFIKLVKEGDIESLDYIQDDSKRGLQNQIIQSYKAVLLNSDVIKDVVKPIDHPFIKDDILNLQPPLGKKDLSTFNIIDEINLKYEFLAGKAGVGITANQLVDHFRGQMSNNFLPYLNIGEKNGEYSKIDNEYSEELSDKDFAYYAKEINKGKKEGDKINVESLKKIKIADAISAIMNANVDIVKDSYITRGNWTTQTTNVGLMLIRAGVHPFKVNAIIGNPILKEYVDFVNNSESKIVNVTGNMISKFKDKKILEDLEGNSININGEQVPYGELYTLTKYGDLKDKLRSKYSNISDALVTEISKTLNQVIYEYNPSEPSFDLNKISLEKYRNQITKYPDSELSVQLLNEFSEWTKIAKEDLGVNMKATKMDVNGYGKNVTAMIISNNLFDKLLTGGTDFIGFNNKLNFDGNPTLLEGYRRNIDEVFKVMKANPLNFLVAQDKVVNTFNQISKGITGDVLLQDSLADKLEKSYYTYFMSGFTPLQLNAEQQLAMLESMPIKIDEYHKANKDNKDANKFLMELDIKLGEDNKAYVAMSNRQKSPSTQTELITAWKDLLEDNPDLGKDLIKYAVLTSGLQMSINQFHTYIPYEFFAENNFNQYIEQVAQDLNNNDFNIDDIFIDSFFRHNLKDNQIVKLVFNNQLVDNVDGIGFVIEKPGRGNLYVKKQITQTNPVTMEKDVFLQLYKLEGYDANDRAIYTRTVPIGLADKKGNKVFEYTYNQKPTGSIISSNKVRIVDTRNKFRDKVAKDKNSEIIKGENYLNKKEGKEVTNEISKNNNLNIKNHKMYYKMPSESNIWNENTTTLDEVESGRRTATTRSFPLGKIGDRITFENKPQQYIITNVDLLTNENVNNPDWIKKWSSKEGWTEEYYKSVLNNTNTVKVGSYQTTFKKVDNLSNNQLDMFDENNTPFENNCK